MKHEMKWLSVMLVAGLIVSSVHPVAASGRHTSNTLFDFHSGQSESEKSYDAKSNKQKTEAPISTTINAGNTTVKRMIVKTKKPLSSAKQKALLGKHGTYNRSLASVNAFSAYIPTKNVSILMRDSNIDKIYVDSVVTSMGYPQPNPSSTVSAPTVWEKFGVKGSGVGVAVLDTGIYPHKDLKSVVAFKDMVNGKTSPYDDNGHGTHVSGIIAGNGFMSEGKYVGTAPQVDIVSVKVLDSNEKGYISNVIGGIDWVISNKDKYNIKVMNLSLGTAYSGETDPLIEAVEKASKAGIFVVVAAGNNGYGGKVTSPAVAPSVVAVGSTSSNRTITPYDDVISSFSVKPQIVNGRNKPEIFAPGEDIVSLLAPEGSRSLSDRGSIVDGWYYKTSGTSMSAPVVSAGAAMLYASNPRLNPSQVKEKLMNSTVTVKGTEVLNVAKAFGVEPSFDEKPSTTVPKAESPQTMPEFTSDSPKEESDLGQSEPVKENDTTSTFSPEPVVPSDEVKKEDPPSFQSGKDESGKDESSKDANSFATTPELKTDASIPVVSPYQINNGYPFVEETYEKRNILDMLMKNSTLYKNEAEIKYSQESVQDVIRLFNLINRSFTKEDFLYFEQRMKK